MPVYQAILNILTLYREKNSKLNLKTDFVIVKDMDDLSDKVQKAIENNIRVLTKTEFEKKYM